MRIIPLSIFAIMIFQSIAVSASGGEGGGRFEISTRTLASTDFYQIYRMPSIDGDIAAWTQYDYLPNGRSVMYVRWADIGTGEVRNITEGSESHSPSVSSGRIAFIGENNSLYLFDVKTGHIEMLRERGCYNPLLAADLVCYRNSKDSGINVLYLGNRTVRALELECNDYQISGTMIAYISPSDTVGIFDLETGEMKVICSTRNNPQAIHFLGDRLVWTVSPYPEYEGRIVQYEPGSGIEDITSPTVMSVYDLAASGDLMVWSGMWNIDNVSGSMFVRDVATGRTLEQFENDSWISGFGIDGNRFVYYRTIGSRTDIVLAEIVSDPLPAEGEKERMDLRSVLGPTLALDLALVVACLALALLPARSPWREYLIRRSGADPPEKGKG